MGQVLESFQKPAYYLPYSSSHFPNLSSFKSTFLNTGKQIQKQYSNRSNDTLAHNFHISLYVQKTPPLISVGPHTYFSLSFLQLLKITQNYFMKLFPTSVS